MLIFQSFSSWTPFLPEDTVPPVSDLGFLSSTLENKENRNSAQTGSFFLPFQRELLPTGVEKIQNLE